MIINVLLIDEQNGRWGWTVSGDGIEGGGKKTASDKEEAEQQAKEFVKMLINTEKVSLATDSVILSIQGRPVLNAEIET